MNKAISHTATFSLVLVLALILQLTIVQGFSQEKYALNAANQRNFLEVKSTPRGQIIAGGATLASSYQDADELYQREYGDQAVEFSPVTGYVSDVYGTSQLEETYNGVLNGTDFYARQLLDHLTRDNPAGNNVELTLDPNVQQVAYDQLASNGYEGSIVAIRPSTGEVVAMASTPSYDPNLLANGDTAEQAWEELNADPSNPLLNHAAQETLPPGSIFKIITAAAGLKGDYTVDSQLTGAPQITLPNTETELTNYNGNACTDGSDVSLETAFKLSCNTAFVQLGLAVGEDEFRSTAEDFGVGENYDLGLPTSSGELGELPDQAAVGQSAIGQRDVTMSALQAAVMAATVANNGHRMEPHVVSRITGPDLNEIDAIEPKELNAPVDEDIAGQLRGLMIESEKNTTGYNGEDIASKTGTAEHGAEGEAPHTWYVGFGPTEDADIAVAVVVKDGGGQGQSATGGKVASPLGRAVIQAALG